MTDETPKKRARRRPAAGDASPPASAAPGAAAPGDVDDPDATLLRLESMGAPGGAGSSPLPPAPAVAGLSTPPDSAPPSRPMGSRQGAPRSRPRPAAGPSSTRAVARIAAPVLFLIAVIALIGIVVQSGVMSGSPEPTPTPTVKATQTKGGTTAPATRKYVVKSGDSLSSIADRFNTSISALQELNPDLSGSTLAVGQRIVVPAQ